MLAYLLSLPKRLIVAISQVRVFSANSCPEDVFAPVIIQCRFVHINHQNRGCGGDFALMSRGVIIGRISVCLS